MNTTIVSPRNVRSRLLMLIAAASIGPGCVPEVDDHVTSSEGEDFVVDSESDSETSTDGSISEHDSFGSKDDEEGGSGVPSPDLGPDGDGDGDAEEGEGDGDGDGDAEGFCGDGIVGPNEECDVGMSDPIWCDNGSGIYTCLADCSLDDSTCDCHVGTALCPCKPGDVCGEKLECVPDDAGMLLCQPIDVCVGFGEPCLATDFCCAGTTCVDVPGAVAMCQ